MNRPTKSQMGEAKDTATHNEKENQKPIEAQNDNENAVVPTFVLKMDMHCEGCAKKVKRAIKTIKGVKDVKVDYDASKVIVIGKVDIAQIREKLENKKNLKVDIISAQSKNDGVAAEKKAVDKSEKKSDEKIVEEKKQQEKITKESVVLLKMRLHCEDCIQKIRKIILKIRGVDSIDVDSAKELVTVKGKMDVKNLASYLKDKLRRDVEVVLPEQDGGAEKKDDKEKKDKDVREKKSSSGIDKGKMECGTIAAAEKVEVKKLEHFGYAQSETMYWNGNGGGVYGPSYNPVEYHQYGYSAPSPSYAVLSQHNPAPSTSYGVVNHHYDGHGGQYGYPHQEYVMNNNYSYHMDASLNAPQMFSEENPYACSIM